ncbi:MAG: hypothetical protein H0T62_00500 [Parachlamydiaceae bacterium]|nr:hypothetical protein [Parachlamydiaceae bacterium]
MRGKGKIFKLVFALLGLLKFNAGEASFSEGVNNSSSFAVVSNISTLNLVAKAPVRAEDNVVVTFDNESQSPITLDTHLSILILPAGESSKFLQITPFATAPNGKIQMGETSSVPVKAATVQLKSLIIEHPQRGNYVVGVFVSLAADSVPLESSTLGFSGAVVGQLENQVEYALIPSSIVGAPLLNTPHAVVTVSTNFEMQVPKLAPVTGPSDAKLHEAP